MPYIWETDLKEETETKKQNSHHKRILSMIVASRQEALNNEELPDAPDPLLRVRAMPIVPSTPRAVYFIKQNAELLIDRGEYLDPLERRTDLIYLGVNPIPCMPLTVRRAFQSELKNAHHAFFQRSLVRKIIQETTSIHKELIEIIIKYR